ncbi:MAG: HD domain-containing protein [Elusimicrobia bacterium]|nr:HD domain-containing protein [Elusimicrobiota bacterium]
MTTLRRAAASALALALAMGTPACSAPVIEAGPPVAGGAQAVPSVAVSPQAWSAAFTSFGSWLATPSGLAIAAIDPALASLATLAPEARRAALLPAAEHLAPAMASRLAQIAALARPEQEEVVLAVSTARRSAAELRSAQRTAEALKPPVAEAAVEVEGPAAPPASGAPKRDIAPLLPAQPRAPPGPGSGLPGPGSGPPGFYAPGHWSPAAVGDRRYAARLAAAARLLSTGEGNSGAAAKRDLLETVRKKDGAVYSHLMRVGLVAGLLAWHMGFPLDAARRIAWAGRAHDVGKRDDAILALVNKPEKLTQQERRVVERHAAVGAGIIQADAALDPMSRRVAMRAAESHHENFDGTGYPHGLKGERIPLEARIVAAADFYDALMEDRPYRAGLGQERTLALMEKERAKFDPAVFRAFLALLGPAFSKN